LKRRYIQKISSCENLTDLSIKSLLMRTFEQMIHKFGLRRLNDESLYDWKNIISNEQYNIIL